MYTNLRKYLPRPPDLPGLIAGFWRRILSRDDVIPPRNRYQRAVAEFKQDKFRRLLFGAVAGVTAAHYLNMPNTVLVGIFPCSFLLAMDRFSFGDLSKRCVVLMAGLVAGTLTVEVFQSMPYMAAMVTFAIFFVILKLFSRGAAVGPAYNFAFTYSLSSINATYLESTMELAVTEYYLAQTAMIFFLVWGGFAFFPAEKPELKRPAPSRRGTPVGDFELGVYASIWVGIWLVFQFVEWKFALFAFLSFIGAFRCFNRSQMKKIVTENMIVHTVSCGAVALFSILLFSLTGNFFIFLASIVLLLTPFLYYAVYPPRPELGYRHSTMVSGVLVPLTLYVGTDHAAVYQSSLRARLIVLLMLLLWLVVEFVYHAKSSVTFSRRALKRRYVKGNMKRKTIATEEQI